MKRTPEMVNVKPGAATITYSVTLVDGDGATYAGGEVESTLLPDEFIAWAKQAFTGFVSMTSTMAARRAVARERNLPESMVKRTVTA